MRDALCLVMTALRKLPVVEGCDAVPRGQEGGGPEASTRRGGTVVGAAFSSASPGMKVTKVFLCKKKDQEEEGGKENLEGR